MNIFEAVKQSVTTRQAAENYGFRVTSLAKSNALFTMTAHPA